MINIEDNFKFNISPKSFFQVNNLVCTKIFDKVRSYVKEKDYKIRKINFFVYFNSFNFVSNVVLLWDKNSKRSFSFLFVKAQEDLALDTTKIYEMDEIVVSSRYVSQISLDGLKIDKKYFDEKCWCFTVNMI